MKLDRHLVAATLALAASLFMVVASAQTISITPGGRWKAGDEIHFERTKSRSDSASARPIAAKAPVTIRVLDTKSSGHLIRWRYGKATLGDEAPAGVNAQVFESMAELMTDLDFDIELNAAGSFKQLRNWEAVRDRIIAATGEWAAIDPRFKGEAGKAALSNVRALFTSREAVETNLLREVQLFFLLYGRFMKAGERDRYDDFLGNPFGGEAFPAKATIMLKSVDREKQRADFSYALQFDRASAATILTESLAKIAPSNPRREEIKKAMASFDVRDEANLAFDLKDGWPLSLVHERRTLLADRRRIDRLEFARAVQSAKPAQ